MHVISYKAIREFVELNADAETGLRAWYKAVSKAVWSSLVDARQEFPHADPVGDYTVFNIKGNHYRLIAEINYKSKIVFVRGIYTHAEYDQGKWKK